MINVTKTFLPPKDEFQQILNTIWKSNWLTNRGPLVKHLESELKKYLNTSDVLLMTNGTLPLQIVIKAFNLTGEIITTPFSYVATTSSIIWEGCDPIFVDIHPEYFSIDEEKIEKAITLNTKAILATHVFGNPCNVEVIDQIAKKYNLKVIYDAAHCFGVQYKGQSLFNYGDASTCSFHATKLFHTGEGGALFTSDSNLLEKTFYHHNFGHKGKEDFQGLGINAKMSELQAAMGIAVLPYVEDIMNKRKSLIALYMKLLDSCDLSFMKIRQETTWNYSYFPVLCSSKQSLNKLKKCLNENDIFPRRYFYPSLNTLPYVKSNSCPISEDISNRILCLPLYHDLEDAEVKNISKLIKETL